MANGFNYILKNLNGKGILHYSWYEAMHTRMDILLHGNDTTELDRLSVRIHELVLQYDAIADRFNANSEISRLNRSAGKGMLQVSEPLFCMIWECLEANTRTNGLFDITINSPDHSENTIRNMALNARTKSIHLKENTLLDLNGYVKGYTLDQIRKTILSSTIKNALINLGNSSIMAIGNHPFGKGWKIGSPNSPESSILLWDQCLTTSGNIFVERQHIRHPFSHRYVTGRQTLSVITPTGTTGEILSTVLLLATEKQQSDILRQFDLPETCLIR